MDSGVQQGATVSVHYDPMLAKLVVWGETRPQCIERLRSALQEFVVEGIKTILPLHAELCRDAAFMEGGIDIHFLERKLEA